MIAVLCKDDDDNNNGSNGKKGTSNLAVTYCAKLSSVIDIVSIDFMEGNNSSSNNNILNNKRLCHNVAWAVSSGQSKALEPSESSSRLAKMIEIYSSDQWPELSL